MVLREAIGRPGECCGDEGRSTGLRVPVLPIPDVGIGLNSYRIDWTWRYGISRGDVFRRDTQVPFPEFPFSARDGSCSGIWLLSMNPPDQITGS